MSCTSMCGEKLTAVDANVDQLQQSVNVAHDAGFSLPMSSASLNDMGRLRMSRGDGSVLMKLMPVSLKTFFEIIFLNFRDFFFWKNKF